jgi:hypothetical protein
MTTDKPISYAQQQPQDELPTEGFPDVLMDDTQYIMDDPEARMGNEAVNSEELRTDVNTYKPKTVINNPRF